MSLEVAWDDGVAVKCGETSICLDPQTSKTGYKHIFISHAHRDHTYGFTAEKSFKYSTKPTAEIFEVFSKKKLSKIKKMRYGEKVKVEDFEVTAYDSGHILGSAAYHIHTREGSVLYTGDLNCINTLVTKAAEPVEADVLIIESTYGNPEFLFPSRSEVYSDMVKWVIERIAENKVPTFYAYTVGKSQEIIKILNEFTEAEVIVHPTIAKVNEIYCECKINLNAAADSGQVKSGKCVKVIPNGYANSYKMLDEASAKATGWSLKFRSRNSFPLSSHADFFQLLNFVKNVNPKIAYTCFGENQNLAFYIKRKLDILAKPLY